MNISITTRELAHMIRFANMNFDELEESDFDRPRQLPPHLMPKWLLLLRASSLYPAPLSNSPWASVMLAGIL